MWIGRKRFAETMARYKTEDSNSLLLPVVLPEQFVPGGFAFALDSPVDRPGKGQWGKKFARIQKNGRIGLQPAPKFHSKLYIK